MEESPHIMWLTRNIFKARFHPLFDSSNNFSPKSHEIAYSAEDMNASACYIWPQRSYTCSFCKQKFRSAQALGGHMNIHRRDKARLNQQYHLTVPCCDHAQHLCKLVGYPQHHSYPFCSSLDKHDLTDSTTSTPLSIVTPPCSRVSYSTISSPISLRYDTTPSRYFSSTYYDDYSVEKYNMSMGLNSFTEQKVATAGGYSSCVADGALMMTRKRPKMMKVASTNDRDELAFQSANVVLGLKLKEEVLDLELRLGNAS